MWRTYTREKPARSGWAIPATALTLAGAVAFAWGITERKNQPLLAEKNFAPADWPIAFSLPGDFAPPKKSVPKGQPARFTGANGRTIVVQYLPPGSSNPLIEVLTGLLNGSASANDEADVHGDRTLDGPNEHWRISRRLNVEGAADLRAYGDFEAGGNVVVQYFTPAWSPRDERVLSAVCESVRLRND